MSGSGADGRENRYLLHDQAPLSEAEVVFVPLTYEGSASYLKGTAAAPAAIVAASAQLEYYEEELGWRPTQELKLHTLELVSPVKGESPQLYLARVEEITAAVPKGAFMVGLGGEHSVSVPLVKRSLAGGGTVLVIDAHPDLRDHYGGSGYSHACGMRRLSEAGYSLVQVGLGADSEEEAAYAAGKSDVSQFFSHSLQTEEGVAELLAFVGGLKGQCYLSIDCDGLSTSIMPGVGTPVPGGLGWHRLLELLRALWSNTALEVVSMDVVELRPLSGNPLSEFTAAKIIQKCLSYGFHGRRGA